MTDVHKRIGLSSSIMDQLDAVWRHSRLSLNTKLHLYTFLVQSVLPYGLEAWTLKHDDERRLQAFHMKTQYRILQISWYDFITNDSIREQTKLVDLPLVIADHRHANLGHIIHLPEETLLIPCYSMLCTFTLW